MQQDKPSLTGLGRTRTMLLVGNMALTALLVIAFAMGLIDLFVLVLLLLVIDGATAYLWLRNAGATSKGEPPRA